MKAYLYILKSLKNGTYYVGSTSRLGSRIKQHDSGSVKSTKYKRPYKLVFFQSFDSLNTAHKIELKIKKWKRKDYIKRIIGDKKIEMGP